MTSFRTHRLGTLCATVGILLGLVIRGHGSGQATAPAQLSAEDAKAKETFVRVCVKCHPVERVTAEGQSRSQWENTIVVMQTSRGAVVTPEEFDIVLDYLSKFHGRDAAAVAPAPGGPGPGGRGPRASVGAADRHRVDAAAVVRGQKIYASECVTCHGASARGTERGANLIRSPRMLRDRYGSAIGPYLKSGHPTQTGSAASLTEAQVADISHFIWDRINNTLRGSPDFDVEKRADRRSERGPGVLQRRRAAAPTCHSPTGDLAGYGKRYTPVDIQQRFVFPAPPAAAGADGAGPPRRSRSRSRPDGAPTSGTLVSIDDFHVALRRRRRCVPFLDPDCRHEIVKNDPFAPHVELLDRLTDKAMHDVVAYLETLK